MASLVCTLLPKGKLNRRTFFRPAHRHDTHGRSCISAADIFYHDHHADEAIWAWRLKQPAPDTSRSAVQTCRLKSVLNLVLGKNDQVYWYIGTARQRNEHTTDYSSSGVRRLLTQKNAEIKNLYVFIKASDGSRYQNMVDALDEIMITNTVNYTLLELEPEDEGTRILTYSLTQLGGNACTPGIRNAERCTFRAEHLFRFWFHRSR
jgi:hypothetical protein